MKVFALFAGGPYEPWLHSLHATEAHAFETRDREIEETVRSFNYLTTPEMEMERWSIREIEVEG